MGGSTKKIDTTPSDITGLRNNLASWLQNPNPAASSQGSQGMWNQPTGRPSSYSAPGANATPQGYNGGPGIGNGNPVGGMPNNPSAPRPEGGSSQMMNMGQLTPPQGSGPNPYTTGGPIPREAMMSGSGGQGGGPYPEWMRSGRDGRGGYGMSQNPDETPPPWNPPPGGGQQGPQTGGFNTMFAQPQGGPAQLGPTAVASTPGQINPAQIGMQAIPQVGSQGLNIPQVNAQQLDPRSFDPRSAFTGVGTQFGVPQSDPFNRGQVRDVAGGASGWNASQSVDQLGGDKSAFFQNMMAQLQPAFAQQRATALAAAKEGLGNMGSGTALANALGDATNRSLGQEQATLANYAAQGLQTEVGRQLQEGNISAQVGANNANRALQGDMANQGADADFLRTQLSQGQLGLQGQQLGLQGQIANQNTSAQLGIAGANNALAASQGNQATNLQGQIQNAGNAIQGYNAQNNAQAQNQNAWLQASLANMGANNAAQGQNIANSMNTQQFNAGQLNQANLTQGGFNQAWGQLVNQMGQQNAQNFLQALLGMSTQGVGPAQVVQNPGWGSAVGGILGTGIGALAGGAGAAVGGQIGRKLGGG